jgi:hypothetical protein
MSRKCVMMFSSDIRSLSFYISPYFLVRVFVFIHMSSYVFVHIFLRVFMYIYIYVSERVNFICTDIAVDGCIIDFSYTY